MVSVAVAQLKKCWCSPTPRFDWCARVPERGDGLLVTQFHESPPSAPGRAPAGTASSSHGTSVVTPVGGGTLGAERRYSVCALVTLLFSGSRSPATGLTRNGNARAIGLLDRLTATFPTAC